MNLDDKHFCQKQFTTCLAILTGFLSLVWPIAANAQVSGTFAPAGSLPIAVRNAKSLLLFNDMILVTGGVDFFSQLTATSIYDPDSMTFAKSGNMDAPYDTATPLNNGSVLLAGNGSFIAAGADDNVLTSAELFDPSDGSFSSTGFVLEAVSSAKAVRMADGRVLLIGGRISDHFAAPTATVEIYDPTSSTFSFTGSMSTPRYNHTATLLQNGKVLVAGGNSSSLTDVPLASAEVYDPASGTFISIGNMTIARENHTATVLADGKVLIAGGSNLASGARNSVTATAEVFDPSTDTFMVTGSMKAPREFHTATLLSDGNVLTAGGDDRFHVLSSTELYDQTNGIFSAGPDMTVPRAGSTANLLSDGEVLVAGGLTAFAEAAVTDTAELYVSNVQPAVKMTTPVKGDTISGSVNIVATVSPLVSWINIYIDGSYFTSSPPYSLNWNSTSVANGSHTISTRAFGRGGTQVGSDSILVTVTN